MKPIYLDYNATTPIADEVAEAMIPYLKEHFGNPSSSHYYGVQTKNAVIKARKQIADFLNCQPDEIIFTSGGSESNNYAIKGTAFANRRKGNHIITSSIEHPAVLEVCRFLEKEGFETTYMPVDEYGMVNPADVAKAIRSSTILITIMHANNEIGTIQPIKEISEIARKHEIIFHTDAAQSAGKIPVKVDELGVDLLSIAGHKLYAPKGIGALYVRRGVSLTKQIHGADHEFNAGTENVLEIVGLGEACEIAEKDFAEGISNMRKTRDRLHQLISKQFPQAKLNGHHEKRLPNTLSISFPRVEANTLLSEITDVAASAGAACHSESIDISHVLEAMKVPVEYAMGTIRLSTGRHTTVEEVETAAEIIISAVKRLSGDVEIPETPVPGRKIKLTQFTHGLGCACKLRPQVLEKILQKLPTVEDENAIIGAENSDDASVYKIDDQLALVQTVDFFTPIVDDPYTFGAIAAANSLSDIYAMGGNPLFALNIVGFPSNRLPVSVLDDILRGASDKTSEAGISILGGHTVDDIEPKFGLAVTGIIDSDKIWRNTGLIPGDVLVLTKSIGTGILSTAMKGELADDDTIKRTIDVMLSLNKTAALIATDFAIHACTDITGFGLLGHLTEMIGKDNISIFIESWKVPLIDGVIDFAISGIIPGGTKDNLAYVEDKIKWNEDIQQHLRYILCDAQTSGGLLFGVNEENSDDLVKALNQNGINGIIIGEVREFYQKPIHVM